ncbi:MAG: hypothetical protein AAGF85_00910 [Bacteroidota bacterium]
MLCILMVQACTERMICPAYQSAFIHDEEELRKRFSYFNEDSTPKLLEASKNRYLLLEPVSYRRKLRSLQTIPMKDVYPIEEDSLAFDDEFALAERDIGSRDLYDSADLVKDHSIETGAVDSTAADSAYVISIKKEKFNIDQELYLWYLRKYLVYPDVRLQQEDNAEEAAMAAKKEKKGFFGFFKNLFKKKNKEEEIEGDGADGDVETSATEVDEGEVQEEKKGLFSFLKKGDKPPKEKKPKVKKEKKKKKKDEPPAEAPPEEEDEDDGEDDF